MPLNSFVREQVIYPFDILAQQVRRARRVETIFLAIKNFRWNEIFGDLPQNVFFGELIELQLGWNALRKLHELDVEKRIASLDRMREGHAVAVIRNEMVREPEFEIEIRTLVNKMPALESLFVNEREIEAIKSSKESLSAEE